MALTRASKKKKVAVLTKELETSTTAIIGTFAKMTVAQDFELRKIIRGAGGKYRVLKNKLAAKASEGSKVEQAMKGLKGVSAAAFTSGDPVELAKVFSKWVGDNAEFTFKLGIVDGKLISVEEVKALAAMPPKEEIYAKLLFLINAPAQRLVTVLGATGRDLAVVVNEAVKGEKFSGGAATESFSTVEAAPVSKAEEALVAEVPAAEVPAAEVPAAVEAAPVEVAAPAEVATEPVVAPEPEKQAEAAVTEAPVEAAPVEGAVVAEAAPAEVAAEPVAVTEPEKQAEAAATEEPVEGAVAPEESAS